MGPAIRVEGVGKRYRVPQGGGPKANYRTLRESLTAAAGGGLRRLRGGSAERAAAEEFWALKDVSFEVQPGEVVGIIGRNGAGKSTLLKVLSRITRPTTGRVELNGRVGSLLEVGTGFHPELTGRENIYLNGSILGMTRAEVARKFDEIVAFSEVEKFLDTPVKRYSSGMYVRLAFAVAAHLEPEILIVDEVLAVGDAAFQRKCIRRMTELAQGGGSLLFVSHQLDLIPRFCQRVILLNKGQIVMNGEAQAVLDCYRQRSITSDDERLDGCVRNGSGKARFTHLRLVDEGGRPVSVVRSGRDLRCLLDIQSSYACPEASLAVVVKTVQGSRILSSWTEEIGYNVRLKTGNQTFECCFQRVPLRPGRQMVFELWLHDGEIVDQIEDARVVNVIEDRPTGFSDRPDQGAVLCAYTWSGG